MSYRYIATTPAGLVQQVAVSYLRHGYWWYVTGRIPAMKRIIPAGWAIRPASNCSPACRSPPTDFMIFCSHDAICGEYPAPPPPSRDLEA